ncbi:hypothetical protein BJ508DRAFT_53021 [Ascobolus immersus RN42]|uniref:Uncharacterized protein n=1 Tax=Ascobolus immersus RN42 TaxID=1160509 RepID=A0A3N4HNA6_ASCIM|nr:hypothetical protein BJ508DRAFT_53021 [Ascobolus immersus RN42]
MVAVGVSAEGCLFGRCSARVFFHASTTLLPLFSFTSGCSYLPFTSFPTSILSSILVAICPFLSSILCFPFHLFFVFHFRNALDYPFCLAVVSALCFPVDSSPSLLSSIFYHRLLFFHPTLLMLFVSVPSSISLPPLLPTSILLLPALLHLVP